MHRSWQLPGRGGESYGGEELVRHVSRSVGQHKLYIYMITKDRELLASGSRRRNFGCNNCRSLMEWNPSSGDLV